MSIGLVVSSEDGELEASHYCQNTAEEAMAGFFDKLQERGLSEFGKYPYFLDSSLDEEIAKLPNPSKPTPEEIAQIQAMTVYHDAAEVLKEAERAYAAMHDLDEREFWNGKEALISEFDKYFLPALREAAMKKFRIELGMA